MITKSTFNPPRKPIQITKFAKLVFEELLRLNSMHFGVITDERGFSQRQTERHDKAKAVALAELRKSVAEYLPPGANPDDFISYSGEDPAVENAEYSKYLQRALGEMVLCRAVDCYHWYLRQVVLLILDRDRLLLRPWAKKLGIKNKDEISAFERGENRDNLLIAWFRGKEWRTRALVHDYWRMPLGEDLNVLVQVRNCLVHQFSEDIDQEITPLIAANPHLYLKVEDGRINVGFDGADAAVGLVISDLSIIDQCLARYFALPATPFQKPNLRRTLSV
jgi:hypothetical protein